MSALQPDHAQGVKRPTMMRKKTRNAFHGGPQSPSVKRGEKEPSVGVTSLWLGVAVSETSEETYEVGYAVHDGTYTVDFAVHTLEKNETEGRNHATELANRLVHEIGEYREKRGYKFLGAGISERLVDLSPQLPSRLWLELDIVPLVLSINFDDAPRARRHGQAPSLRVDEEADSLARKCLMRFGPNGQPRVTVGFMNEVEVDVGNQAQLTTIDDYEKTVCPRTWTAVCKYVESLKANHTRIAFFNSTPQGGGVALMRHALLRYLRLMGVNTKWYVPRPKPEIFRITKDNHNILQGVAAPDKHLTREQIDALDSWCLENAERYWTIDEGPLAPISKGGAHVIIVDDPQLPSLVRIAKRIEPTRPVIFRSHIQVRADLADQQGTPTSEVWNWVWNNVKEADIFVSHPVREFVPNNVDFTRVAYMPATTDWLDGLNKHLSPYDEHFYMHQFSTECFKLSAARLVYPHRKYIIQIARFDPSKGIPDVLAAYAKLRRQHLATTDPASTPQLVIAGHGAIDDPDAVSIYTETLHALSTTYADLKNDIIVMRLGPSDQILNALLSCAHIALQLSTREGFEVKVSEALHKGIPTIATRAGGIPLQIQHGVSGFLVEPGDADAVARYLALLLGDGKRYEEMSGRAEASVSDEVGTVGNALCWVYLAERLRKGGKVEGGGRWVFEEARREAGVSVQEGENRLGRGTEVGEGGGR